MHTAFVNGTSYQLQTPPPPPGARGLSDGDLSNQICTILHIQGLAYLQIPTICHVFCVAFRPTMPDPWDTKTQINPLPTPSISLGGGLLGLTGAQICIN